MNLEQITTALNNQFKDLLPENSIVVSTSLGHCIKIRLSLDKRENWSGGIFHNSRYLIALVFCNGQYEKGNDTYSFNVSSNRSGVKVMQKNNVNGEAMLKHITAQLNKLVSSI